MAKGVKKEAHTRKCFKCEKQQGINKYKNSWLWCDPCRKKIKTVEMLEQLHKDSSVGFNKNLWNLSFQNCSEKYKELSLEEIEQKSIGYYFRQYNLPNMQVGQLDSDGKDKSKNLENISDEDIRFWGRFTDYTQEDYDYLNENYESWITECKSDTLAEKKLYKQICLQELEIQKLREKGQNVVKEIDTLQKLMDSANVKPKDINAANDPSNANVLGMIIKDIEMYRPAEYFEDKKIYADYDGIKDYLNRFVFRPLKNLLLGSRDFDKEFNIETNGDDDG